MNQDFSIVTLVLHASIVVQVVMAGLMIASLASWTVIFGKQLAGTARFLRDLEAGLAEVHDGDADIDDVVEPRRPTITQ